MTRVTFRLTVKNRNQLRNPTYSNRVWAAFTFYGQLGYSLFQTHASRQDSRNWQQAGKECMHARADGQRENVMPSANFCPKHVNYYYYFASAAVVVDFSRMTASSSASRSRFSPPSNFVNPHVSTMCFIRYDTTRDAILTCARKPTWVSLIYRTEPTTKKCSLA